MADSRERRPRHPFNSTSTSEPHPAPPDPPLRYPTFPPLSASVEEWLSRSRLTNMSSNHNNNIESSSARSLSESWATLSTSDAHSEDGAPSEQTDVGSLIDPTGPDDVTSLDGRYSCSSSEVGDENDNDDHDDDDDDGGQSASNISDSQKLPGLFPRFGGAIDDSCLTARTACHHQSSDSIEFAEPETWPEAERVQLKRTIRIFDEETEAAELKSFFPYSNLKDSALVATVRQTMGKQSLDTDKPFRVLYIGDPEFRNIILDKIGDTLVSSSCGNFESSSTESSKFHVVPTAFGAGAIPNFAELLPIHVQLIVDECVNATSESQTDRPSVLELIFKNRPLCTSIWSGSEYRTSSSSEWTLPDVAICFISNRDDASAVRTRSLALTFMQRHGIPTMMISEEPLWKSTTVESAPLNVHSLHVCLEASLSENTEETTILKRYPVDLKTFESITPNQLNRNLESLTTLHPKKTSKELEDHKVIERKSLSHTLERLRGNMVGLACSNRAREFTPFLRFIAFTIISAVAVSLGYSGLRAAMFLVCQFFARSTTCSAASSASTAAISTTSVPPMTPMTRPSRTSLSLWSPSLHEVQLSNDRFSQYSKAAESMGVTLSTISPLEERSQSDHFGVQTVGDCHVIIKPPHGFLHATKRPRFEVRVSRDDKTLPYELSKLFEEVYSLKLDRQDAHGLVNISISSCSKPHLGQITQVDFGTPWLKIANWKRAVHMVSSQLAREFGTAQSGISETYGRLCTDLQVLMGDVVKKSHFLRQEAELLGYDSAQITRVTRNTILAELKRFSNFVKHIALEQFSVASTAFQERSDKLGTEAQALLSDIWRRIEESARSIDLDALLDSVRETGKSRKLLGKAQMRARKLMGPKSHRGSEGSAGGRGRGRRCRR